MSHENTPLNAVLEIYLVDKGELGHIYPHTVVYHVGRYSYLLAEDERGDYLIKPIFSNGTLGPDIVNKKFRHYYDVIQAAYDDLTATTYICAVSLAGKSMKYLQPQMVVCKVKFALIIKLMTVKHLTSSLLKEIFISTKVVKT